MKTPQDLNAAKKLARTILDNPPPQDDDVERLVRFVLNLEGPDPREVVTEHLNKIRAGCKPPLAPLADLAVHNVANARDRFEALLREYFGTDYKLVILAHGISLDGVPACPRDKFVCSVCGSCDVEHAMWVDPNTDQPNDVFGAWNESDAVWCRACDEHHKIVTESEFHVLEKAR